MPLAVLSTTFTIQLFEFWVPQLLKFGIDPFAPLRFIYR